MNFNLPYGSGLPACNPRSIAIIEEAGGVPIDGGPGKCKKLDSFYYDELVKKGYRGRDLMIHIEADWIISKNSDSNELWFSYVNPRIGSADFQLNDSNFSISGRSVSAVNIKDGQTYKIKVGPSAGKSISYIFENREKLQEINEEDTGLPTGYGPGGMFPPLLSELQEEQEGNDE